MGARHTRSKNMANSVEVVAANAVAVMEDLSLESGFTNATVQEEVSDDSLFVQFESDDASASDEQVPLTLIEASAAPQAFDAPSADELDGLREQLDGKDELISALVVELEQVVEQLDRLQRSGSERPRGPGSFTAQSGSKLSPEAAEEQQQIFGDLQRFVQQWDELQPASVLGRIESELAAMRSLLTHGAHSLNPSEASVRERLGATHGLDGVIARLAIETPGRERTESPTAGSSWESMKRQMLGEDSAVAVVEGSETAVACLSDRSIESPSNCDEELSLERFTGLIAIDLDAATREELQVACAERDMAIVQLTRLLRSHNNVALPTDWNDIAGIPDEVKCRADQLASRLEKQVQLAEVELSLDRARLSRERSQVQAERATIERHLKRLGLSSLDELENIAVESGSASDRRWMRFLGVNRRS